MRERVLQIRLALLGDGPRLIAASEYLDLCRTVDRYSHCSKNAAKAVDDQCFDSWILAGQRTSHTA